MDESIKVNKISSNKDGHQRTIIHVDMDYFYAQVEEINNQTLRNKPLGIQQKDFVVTSNYIARDFGIKKLMTVEEAQKLCPHLVLVRGEDLTPYRKMSAKIFEILHKFSPIVEKLGLDENYIDVSSLVEERLSANSMGDDTMISIKGCMYPNLSDNESCDCGCAKRLAVGSVIAKEIRNELVRNLNITCSAGISYNKLLAKLVGQKNKPNNQTVLNSLYAKSFMQLLPLEKITGIGQKTEALLLENGIATVEDLQEIKIEDLEKKVESIDLANKLKDLSFGRDSAPVKPTGKPKTIGLEDSCKPICVKTDVEERFRLLLKRLLDQVSEDGRIPISIKIVVRKFDQIKRTSHRETRQSNVSSSLFKKIRDGQVMLANSDGQDKLLKTIMRLFERVVDMSKPFNITLLGLAFSKFQDRRLGSASIANFLIKKSDLEVQSVLNLSSDGREDFSSPVTSAATSLFGSIDIQNNYRHNASCSPVPSLMDFDSMSSDFSDFSETDIDQPSPKKSRLGFLIGKRRCFSPLSSSESPSKLLKVAELRLNSRESDSNIPVSINSENQASSTSSIFSTDSGQGDTEHKNLSQSAKIDNSSTKCKVNLTNIPCNVDPEIFQNLPTELQEELLAQWKKPNAASVPSNKNSNRSANTLHRYFIKNN